jgi:energy-coupling factor transporter ATP-binding protein EcfA2
MLVRLYATNYRCLVNFEFKPTTKQLIIGRNGTGKTTVLDVLAMLRDFAVRGLPCEDQLGGKTRTRGGGVREIARKRGQSAGRLDYDGTPLAAGWHAGIKTAKIVIANHLQGCTTRAARRPKWKSRFNLQSLDDDLGYPAAHGDRYGFYVIHDSSLPFAVLFVTTATMNKPRRG